MNEWMSKRTDKKCNNTRNDEKMQENNTHNGCKNLKYSDAENNWKGDIDRQTMQRKDSIEKCAQSEKEKMKKWGHIIQELVLLCAFSLAKLLCEVTFFLTMTTYKKSLLQSRICQYSTFCSQYLLFAYARVKICAYFGVCVCVSFCFRWLTVFSFVQTIPRYVVCISCLISIHCPWKNVFSLSRCHWYCYSSLHFMLKSFFNTFFSSFYFVLVFILANHLHSLPLVFLAWLLFCGYYMQCKPNCIISEAPPCFTINASMVCHKNKRNPNSLRTNKQAAAYREKKQRTQPSER